MCIWHRLSTALWFGPPDSPEVSRLCRGSGCQAGVHIVGTFARLACAHRSWPLPYMIQCCHLHETWSCAGPAQEAGTQRWVAAHECIRSCHACMHTRCCHCLLPAGVCAGLPKHPAQAAAHPGNSLLPALHKGPPGEGFKGLHGWFGVWGSGMGNKTFQGTLSQCRHIVCDSKNTSRSNLKTRGQTCQCPGAACSCPCTVR